VSRRRGISEADLDDLIREWEAEETVGGAFERMANGGAPGSDALGWSWREFEALRKAPVRIAGAPHEYDPLTKARRLVSEKEFTTMQEALYAR
jgi:hypothetical protein